MITDQYRRQVALLLKIMPEVAKEKAFALHGGTAINLFVRDLPRLSVDIDLTYRLIEDRKISLKNINVVLNGIKKDLLKIDSNLKIEHNPKTLKLLIQSTNAQIKLEVNQINRGILGDTEERILCDRAQDLFNAFVAIDLVSLGQLYGGKICAALDRQHPRDLFDVKYLLNGIGITDEIKEGFILALISSNQPIDDLLAPNLIDQKNSMENQFTGMTEEVFSYEDFENTRDALIKNIQSSLDDKDKEFILSIKNSEPDWNIYNMGNFPSVQWKLVNIQKHKSQSPNDHRKQFKKLEERLSSF